MLSNRIVCWSIDFFLSVSLRFSFLRQHRTHGEELLANLYSLVGMSFHCLNHIFEAQAGLANSAESRPVIMPSNGDKNRSGKERNIKLVRILTVVAYVCCVSIAAAMLSLYYVFIWDPASHQHNASTYPAGHTTTAISASLLLRPLLCNCSNSTDVGMLCMFS